MIIRYCALPAAAWALPAFSSGRQAAPPPRCLRTSRRANSHLFILQTLRRRHPVSECTRSGESDDEVTHVVGRPLEGVADVLERRILAGHLTPAVTVAQPLLGHAVAYVVRLGEQPRKLDGVLEGVVGAVEGDVPGGVDRLARVGGAIAADRVEALEGEPDGVDHLVAGGAEGVGAVRGEQ